MVHVYMRWRKFVANCLLPSSDLSFTQNDLLDTIEGSRKSSPVLESVLTSSGEGGDHPGATCLLMNSWKGAGTPNRSQHNGNENEDFAGSDVRMEKARGSEESGMESEENEIESL